VDAVVGDVTRDDGIQARNVNDRRGSGIGLSHVDYAQLVALHVDDIAINGIGNHRVLRNLAGKRRLPEVQVTGADLPLRRGDDGRSGDRSGVGKCTEDHAEAEEVIAVAMGEVDRREILPGRPDPVHNPPAVFGDEASVDQDRVTLAGDQRSRGCRPGRFVLPRWGRLLDYRFVRGNEYIEIQQSRHASSFHSDSETKR
jgi:hypothetical protein